MYFINTKFGTNYQSMQSVDGKLSCNMIMMTMMMMTMTMMMKTMTMSTMMMTMTLLCLCYMQTVVTSCVDNCLLVGRTDFLFGRLYEDLSVDSIAKATYLECLEPYILNDTLTVVTPGVMKDFVEHYEQRGAVRCVESCITHMDIASLDIHQVYTFNFIRFDFICLLHTSNSALFGTVVVDAVYA